MTISPPHTNSNAMIFFPMILKSRYGSNSSIKTPFEAYLIHVIPFMFNNVKTPISERIFETHPRPSGRKPIVQTDHRICFELVGIQVDCGNL